MYYLNVARPLFHDNPALRQAVNFAVDRPRIVRQGGLASLPIGKPTDQYLPPTMPGFRDARIYPLDGPDLRKARALARGHTRSGKVVLGTPNYTAPLAAAQVVKQNLATIGLDVEIKALPPGAYFAQVGQAKTPFDISFGDWAPDYIDPSAYASQIFDSRFIGSSNLSHFASPVYDALMRRAGALEGNARADAYGRLDVRLARDAAPAIAIDFDSDLTLVSKRVGCVLVRPGFGFDLTAACLK
jgi:ABC-type oligopeptide transport system substrate-binding subunit